MKVTRYSNDYKAVRKMFWNGRDEKGKQYYLDKPGITYALGRALKDYTSRTDKKEDGEGILSVRNMTDVLGAFVDGFEKFFISPPKVNAEEYDRWHHDMCALFISCIKDAGLRNTVSYGKAQKIVNMTMKNVYCLEGAEAKDKENYFDFCHMALDSIVLNWFCTYVAQRWFNIRKTRNEKILISREGSLLPKWSSLEFMPESLQITADAYKTNVQKRCYQGHYHYYFFVKMISAYFKDANQPYGSLTPFKAEFYIWQETQMEAAAEALYGLDIEREQTIQKAKEKEEWKGEWATQNMENKTSDIQFKWCKKKFKELSVDDKVAFLSDRVAQLCKYVEIPESTMLQNVDE